MNTIKNITILLLLTLLVSACGNDDFGGVSLAPKNMAGKTLKVCGYTIHFSSNNSATISDWKGTANNASVSYSRKNSISAKLNFSAKISNGKTYPDISDERYNLTLEFGTETSGIANGSYSYNNVINKGSTKKYSPENAYSGTNTVSNSIFSIY